MTIGLSVNVVGGIWLDDRIAELVPIKVLGESVAKGTKQKPQERAQNVRVKDGAVIQYRRLANSAQSTRKSSQTGIGCEVLVVVDFDKNNLYIYIFSLTIVLVKGTIGLGEGNGSESGGDGGGLLFPKLEFEHIWQETGQWIRIHCGLREHHPWLAKRSQSGRVFLQTYR